ncbi:hypothetical protein CBL_09310 [Carabus blaptoides fortunei]
MKGFGFFITVLVACHASVANSTELLTLLLTKAQDKPCVLDGLQCKNSNEMQYCASGSALFTMQCADQNPLKPYCDLETDMCTSAILEDPTIPANFICPDAGYYPDLLDCRKNHYCVRKGSNPAGSESIRTMPNIFFHYWSVADNPILLACPSKDFQFDVSSVTCIFKCKANGRFPYPGDESKYYHCVYTGNKYVQQILECPGDGKFEQDANNGNGKCSQ